MSDTAEQQRIPLPGGWFFQQEHGALWSLREPTQANSFGLFSEKAARQRAAALAPQAPAGQAGGEPSELVSYIRRQWVWSKETFGPALRTKGVIQHIRKELLEIERAPHDLSEWVDVIILAMDGFWRHGGQPEDLLPRMQEKQDKNFARQWLDWRTMGEDQAIEHDRSGEALSRPPTPAQSVPADVAGAYEDAIAAVRLNAGLSPAAECAATAAILQRAQSASPQPQPAPDQGAVQEEDERPLSAKEQAMIDAAWEKHKAAGPQYICKRCGMNEFQAREKCCQRGPCPMELAAPPVRPSSDGE